MKEILLTNELSKLYIHLQHNQRSILSAKFGNGKTTLLKQFQEKYKNEYEFFVLQPVNYAVGSNEDVFEYIKRDILLQMSDKGLLNPINLDEVEAAFFTWDNISDLIGFLLSMSPAGERAAKLWEKFKPLVDRAKKINDEYEDLKHDIEKYAGFFKKQKGGIYEHDAYTILIEKALEVVRSRTSAAGCDFIKNKTMLIVEDMDRIDPAHLFRILNVFGAHIDTDANRNKFGFSNILLVLDTDTTEHIFHHFYGEKANYEGYISKFITHNTYRFDIRAAAEKELTDFLMFKCKMSEDMIANTVIYKDSYNEVKLYDYIRTLSVRKIASILNNIENAISEDYVETHGIRFCSRAPITYLLAVLVRMDRKITYHWVFRSMCETPQVIYVLDAFLLIHQICQCGAPFEYKENMFAAVAETDSNNITSIKIAPTNSLFDDNGNMEEMFEKSFELAMTKVHDCKNIEVE